MLAFLRKSCAAVKLNTINKNCKSVATCYDGTALGNLW